MRFASKTVAFAIVSGAALIIALAVGIRYFDKNQETRSGRTEARRSTTTHSSQDPEDDNSLGNLDSGKERDTSDKNSDAASEPNAPIHDGQPPIRNRFSEATSWKQREKVLLSIPKDGLVFYQGFLFEIAEGTDVDAVRYRAVELLREHGVRSSSAYGLSIRMSHRVSVEPRPVIRKALVNAMEHYYRAHPQESEFLVDVFARVLRQDPDSGVRRRAALTVGWELKPDRALPLLKAALKTEKDQEVRKELETGIRLQQEGQSRSK